MSEIVMEVELCPIVIYILYDKMYLYTVSAGTHTWL